MQLASRLENLGTETAFAVSLAAADWAARGNRVYPFHLGDMNLPTPENVVAAMDRAIADGMTGYCAAAGIMPLREALADDVGRRRGLVFEPGNVVVQPGGKPVIGKFIQTVMEAGDEVLYPNPGYPIYESQIEYHGGTAVPYRYIETPTGFALDLEYLESRITPRTTALIYNDLQNPLSAESSAEEMQAVADLAIRNDLWVLSDEAYFEMRYGGESHSIASLPGMQERTVILYTFSKKFAMTGWRLGAAIAPIAVADTIAKLNTNDESCTAHFVQWAGLEGISGDQSGPARLREVLRSRRDAAVDAVNAVPGMHTARPQATFYLFVNVTEAMRMKGFTDVSEFATAALHHTGVSFCTRRHFGRPQPGEIEQYIRLAYSGISAEDITEGLGLLRDWVAA
ncbi:MAG: pyridoxal phosphate-dependent aminotransferase [Ilumatobacteraceae bacterium]